MTESDWLRSSDPQEMFAFVRKCRRASDRKLRLYAAACCRCIWHLLSDERSRRAVEAAELFADGAATEEERNAAWNAAHDVLRIVQHGQFRHVAAMAAERAALGKHHEQSWWKRAASAAECAAVCLPGEREVQAPLLRDLFSPWPFRSPPLASAVLAWKGGVVKRLAEAAYEERSLPSGRLDAGRLAVLADALEETGADPALVVHLREPGPHVRGCFVIDLLLRKG